jgi:transposase
VSWVGASWRQRKAEESYGIPEAELTPWRPWSLPALRKEFNQAKKADPRFTAADMTDCDAAKEVLFRLRLMHPEITIVWADSAYAGQLVGWAKKYLNLTIKTVSRPKDAKGFVVLPRRWVVERSHAWIMHARRHARDHERLVQHSESLITWAAITIMTRRITQRQSRRKGQPEPREAQRD